MLLAMSHDEFTQAKWDERWTESETAYDPSAEPQLRDSLALITRFWPEPRGRFLEAGCGTAANGLNLALRGADVAGIDLSPSAVRGARDQFARRGLTGEFLVGDVRQIPFPDTSFDFVYAGGVVEHFDETSQAVAEMARVLDVGGRVLVTVPALTLAYPYLFLRGNIPAVPILGRAIEAVQFGLLRGALATFGYERSFTRTQLQRLLTAAALVEVEVGRFDTYLPLLQVPALLRRSARRLARTNAFAPMWYVTGVRGR